jgi:hypothetical protein
MPSLQEFYLPRPPFRVISDSEVVQEHYVDCRRNGTSHSLAEMFAFRRGPALDTDTMWISERTARRDGNLGDETLLREAKAAGVNVRRAEYKSGLARYPGDPEAWVESKADCIRVAAKRGLTLEGGVNYTPPEIDEPAPLRKPYRVADDILSREVARRTLERGEPVDREQVAEECSGR